MLAKKTSKNQLTLPKEIVKRFPNVQYFDVQETKNGILLVPVRIAPDGTSLKAIREKMARLGIAAEDVGDAVKWARNGGA